MTQELRWAARYAFVEELWRGRARVIVDPGLEALLREGGPGFEHGIDPALDELLERLLPSDPSGGEAVWMGVATVSTAAELGRLRPGTTFVPYEGIADVLRRAHWDISIVDLGAAVLGPPEGSPEMTTEPDVQAPSFGAGVYFRRALATVHTLGMTVRDDRTVVVCSPVRDYPRIEQGLEYGELFELAEQTLGPPRLFGVYCPPMAAVVDFGEGEDADTEVDDIATEVAYDAEDISLSYDNTLGSQEPALTEYLAVVGRSAELSGGLTLVELPHLAHLASLAGETAESGARAQLMQARRRADLAAIERQDQLERAEELERENAELRRELETQVVAPARPTVPAPSFDRESALEAALGREQALKWRVSQLEAELVRVQARPIEALEAEVLVLEARLEAASAEGESGPDPRPRPSDERPVDAGRGEDPGEDVVIIEEAPGLPQSRLAAVQARLGRVMTRIERGGMPTLALRQELCALRRLLRSHA